MTELPQGLVAPVLIGTAILLYAFAWSAVGNMPRWARLFARLALLAIVAAPIALMVVFGVEQSRDVARAPPATSAPDVAAPTKSTEPPAAPSVEEPSEPAGGEASATDGAKSPPADDPADNFGRGRGSAEESAEPPAVGAPAPELDLPKSEDDTLRGMEPQTGTEPQGSGSLPPALDDQLEKNLPSGGLAPPVPELETQPGEVAPPPSPAPAPSVPAEEKKSEEQTDYDVVPVFYGTDREQTALPKRIDYGANRARRLELGRALVTIPKSHEVPAVERPWAIRIPYFDVTLYEEAEDPQKHFTMKELKALSREDFLAVVRERLGQSQRFKDHALVFIHGFNTHFDNAVYRTAQIAYDLKFDGAPFLYSWPSGGGVASYTYDRESAGQSTPYLRDFLNLVIKETGAKSVSVIAHSMGNQPALQVLKDLKAAAPEGVLINQIILAAPDVDRDNFENIANEIQGLANGITLYAAANDRALSVSRRFNGGVPRAGDVPETGPLVLPGVDTIDVTAASTDSLGLNHSGYAENNALLNDIQLLLQTGERPPDKRIPILQLVPTALGNYWRYPPKP